MHDHRGNNGPLMDLGRHLYMQWPIVFDSRPVVAYARERTFVVGRPELAQIAEPAIDTAVVTVEYASGDISTLTISWGLAAGTKLRGRPGRLVGPQGGAERTPEGLKVYDGDRVETAPLARGDLHQKAFVAFAEDVAAGRAPRYGFRERREMLALTEAIFRSIETGAPAPVSCDFAGAAEAVAS